MQLRLQKASLFIFYASMVVIFIGIVCFMTDYYSLFVYGDSDMGELYTNMQIFNKTYYNSFLVVIVANVLLLASGIHKKVISKIGTGYLAFATLITLLVVSKNMATLSLLKNQYMSFDFSNISEITYSLTWFNVLNTASIITLVLSIVLAITTILNVVSKKKG